MQMSKHPRAIASLTVALAVGSGIFLLANAQNGNVKQSGFGQSKPLKIADIAPVLIKTEYSQPSKKTSEKASNRTSKEAGTTSETISITPKPLSNGVIRGLAYLVSQQDKSGGWAQGDEARTMGSANKIGEVANVADTCLASLALMRAGNYPNSGKYSQNVNRAVAFVCESIEKADADSIYVTDVRNTRVQMKLGPYVDTFFASLLLSEAKNHMPDDAGLARVRIALQKVVHKIQHNQQADGQWSGGGWAPIHSQALAIRGLNRAKQVGAVVSDDSLLNAENFAKKNFDRRTGSFRALGSAGIELYSAGATVGALQGSIDTNSMKKIGLNQQIASATTPELDKANARKELERIKDAEDEQKQAMEAVSNQIRDDKFIAGFGCNGGEEFLSYLHISEGLIAGKRSEFPAWDKKITANLNNVQNQDGSWMGQHCITSRTFCTGAALMVLMADRSANQSIASK